MNYEVVLLRNAQSEFHAIVDWLVQRSPQGAMKWLEAYEQVVNRLESDPESFGFAPENDSTTHTVRQSLFQTPRGKTYRLLFTVVGRQVRVLHLRGPGQDWSQFER